MQNGDFKFNFSLLSFRNHHSEKCFNFNDTNLLFWHREMSHNFPIDDFSSPKTLWLRVYTEGNFPFLLILLNMHDARKSNLNCSSKTPKRHEKDCFWGFSCEERRMSPEKEITCKKLHQETFAKRFHFKCTVGDGRIIGNIREFHPQWASRRWVVMKFLINLNENDIYNFWHGSEG